MSTGAGITVWRGLQLASFLVLAGCARGDTCNSFGFDVSCLPERPEISGLKITPLSPEQANTVVRYSAQVDVNLFQGTGRGGQCEIALSVGTISIPITSLSFRVTCPFTVTVLVPSQVIGSIRVLDSEGHRSNSLSFVLGIGL